MYDFDERLNVGKVGEEFLDRTMENWFYIQDVSLEEEIALGIDRVFTRKSNNEMLRVEYKVDTKAHSTGNFFIELSIHYDDGGEGLGWARKTKSDVVLYLVPEEAIYVLDSPKIVEASFSGYRQARGYSTSWHSVGAVVPKEDMGTFIIKRISLTHGQ